MLSRGGVGAGMAWTDWSLTAPMWSNSTLRVALARRIGAPLSAPGLQCARRYADCQRQCGA
eukprot:3746204-Lingulodinium_polyedra.AAC.1